MTANAPCADPTLDEAVVMAAIDDMYDAFLANDRRRFDSHLDDDITTWETHLPRMVDRRELDRYRDERSPDSTPRLSELRVEPARVDIWDDHAVACYVLVAVPANAENEDVTTTRVTDVLRRVDEEWRIVHHHAEVWSPAAGEEERS